MKNSRWLLIGLSVLVVGTSLVSCQKVEVGYAGVKIYTLGSERGETEIVKPGWVWLWPNEELVSYPTFIKQYPFTKGGVEGSPRDEAFYFQSKEGVQCNVDIAIEARADASKADVIYKTYRMDLEDIIKTNLRQRLRELVVNEASRLSVDELYSDKKEKMMNTVQEALRVEMAKVGIEIRTVSMLSNIRFPELIIDQINQKIAAKQEAERKKNEIEKAIAEAEIKTTQAEAEAQSNRLRQASITSQMIQWQEVLNQQEAIKKWDGKLPSTILSKDSVPFINVTQ